MCSHSAARYRYLLSTLRLTMAMTLSPWLLRVPFRWLLRWLTGSLLPFQVRLLYGIARLCSTGSAGASVKGLVEAIKTAMRENPEEEQVQEACRAYIDAGVCEAQIACRYREALDANILEDIHDAINHNHEKWGLQWQACLVVRTIVAGIPKGLTEVLCLGMEEAIGHLGQGFTSHGQNQLLD